MPAPPSRPRLRPDAPVLRRGPDEVQVGLEPGRAVVLRGAGLLALLRRLDGLSERTDLEAWAAGSGLGHDRVGQLLQALDEAGLLGAEPSAPAAGSSVRLIGVGFLAQQLSQLLLTAGVDVHAADPRGRPADPAAWTEVDPGLPGPRSRGRLRLVTHWSKPDHHVGLTVLALDTVEPDRLLADHLMRHDHPHLVLRCGGTHVSVGPLVLPGRTACLRCTDLARRDADPAWPELLTQLTRLVLPAGPVLTSWVAAVGATHVLAHLCGAVPESVGATLELGLGDHRMTWRAWPQHASCGCAWSGTTEWGP